MKKVLIGLFVLLALLVGGIALLPGEYEVKRSRVVAATPAEVYAAVLDLHTWPSWSVWSSEADPDCVWNYNDKVGVGASNEWNGPELGKGGLTVTASEENTKIDYDLFFVEGDDRMESQGRFEFVPSGDGTEVTWVMHGEFEGFLKLFGLLMDSMVGPDFEEGLTGLDNFLQKPDSASESN
ncbi:MAG: hypothetical protein ACI8X5_002885 [Planctomycetota bacterium]|jgi:uncharacterized protein YndB with AHSA1/START domain